MAARQRHGGAFPGMLRAPRAACDGNAVLPREPVLREGQNAHDVVRHLVPRL